MQCPHCLIHFHDNWEEQRLSYSARHIPYFLRVAVCPAREAKYTIELRLISGDWRRIVPRGSSRPPVPAEVPKHIAQDYTEACEVLPISAKASAALSRRCLQTMLRAHGYKARDLAGEIELLLKEPDTTKAIPTTLRQTIDGVRNFGNFSAHPITDVTTLQIIDVEPHEAEECLQTVEEMFEHFYVRPALAKKRKDALDAKLKAAGKLLSK